MQRFINVITQNAKRIFQTIYHRPACYGYKGSSGPMEFACPRPECGGTMKLIRHISFVDCPGHDIYMATMLSGASVMDAALLLIAGNEPCPQPQVNKNLKIDGRTSSSS